MFALNGPDWSDENRVPAVCPRLGPRVTHHRSRGADPALPERPVVRYNDLDVNKPLRWWFVRLAAAWYFAGIMLARYDSTIADSAVVFDSPNLAVVARVIPPVKAVQFWPLYPVCERRSPYFADAHSSSACAALFAVNSLMWAALLTGFIAVIRHLYGELNGHQTPPVPPAGHSTPSP